MKFLSVLAALILAGLGAFILLSARDFRSCYLTYQPTFDDLAYKTRVYNWSADRVCEVEMEALGNLGVCLEAAQQKQPQWLFSLVKSYVDKTLGFLRYGAKDYWVMVAEHNRICEAYPAYIMPGPKIELEETR